MAEYIGVVETAKLIRAALKESFPEIKFSVKSKSYAGGASINVNWTDGPNDAQVNAVIGVFEGAYFDGSIDYKGSCYAMIDGKQVCFGADFVFTNRSYSDAMVQRAIDRVYREYAGNFAARNLDKPSVEAYGKGQYYSTYLMGGYYSLQQQIGQVLEKMSDRLQVAPSKTAGKVIYLGNDGYSDCGALNAQALS